MGNYGSVSLKEEFTGLKGDGFSDKSWELLIDKPSSIVDVFEAVSSEDVEGLITTGLSAVQSFIKRVLQVLNQPFTSTDTHTLLTRKQNGLRYLTRILPILHRHKEPHIQAVFWGPEDYLAVDILQAVLTAAFMRGFCLPADSEGESDSGIWYSGINAPNQSNSYFGVEENQAEGLRCLIACCCGAVYGGINEVEANPWLSLLVQPSTQHISELVYSLVNAVIGYKADGMLSLLSFALMSQEVVTMSAQLLVILLHAYEDEEEVDPRVARALRYISSPQKEENSSEIPVKSAESGDSHPINAAETHIDSPTSEEEIPLDGISNTAVSLISDLDSDSDFQLLFSTILRLLSYRKDLSIEEEVLLLTWQLLYHNPRFNHYISRQPEAKELLVHLLALMWTSMEEQAGPLQVSAFILLLLSSQRTFCLQMAEQVSGVDLRISVPQGVNTLFDVSIVLTQHLSTNKQHLPLISILLSALTNANHFIKTISSLASAALVTMLKSFTSVRTLWGDVYHLQLVKNLLDMLTIRLQYYWEVGAM